MTIKEIIKNTDKNIYLTVTVGCTWKDPAILRKLVSKEEAIKNIEWGALSEIDKETEDSIYLHVYCQSDMWIKGLVRK